MSLPPPVLRLLGAAPDPATAELSRRCGWDFRALADPNPAELRSLRRYLNPVLEPESLLPVVRALRIPMSRLWVPGSIRGLLGDLRFVLAAHHDHPGLVHAVLSTVAHYCSELLSQHVLRVGMLPDILELVRSAKHPEILDLAVWILVTICENWPEYVDLSVVDSRIHEALVRHYQRVMDRKQGRMVSTATKALELCLEKTTPTRSQCRVILRSLVPWLCVELDDCFDGPFKTAVEGGQAGVQPQEARVVGGARQRVQPPRLQTSDGTCWSWTDYVQTQSGRVLDMTLSILTSLSRLVPERLLQEGPLLDRLLKLLRVVEVEQEHSLVEIVDRLLDCEEGVPALLRSGLLSSLRAQLLGGWRSSKPHIHWALGVLEHVASSGPEGAQKLSESSIMEQVAYYLARMDPWGCFSALALAVHAQLREQHPQSWMRLFEEAPGQSAGLHLRALARNTRDVIRLQVHAEELFVVELFCQACRIRYPQGWDPARESELTETLETLRETSPGSAFREARRVLRRLQTARRSLESPLRPAGDRAEQARGARDYAHWDNTPEREDAIGDVLEEWNTWSQERRQRRQTPERGANPGRR